MIGSPISHRMTGYGQGDIPEDPGGWTARQIHTHRHLERHRRVGDGHHQPVALQLLDAGLAHEQRIRTLLQRKRVHQVHSPVALVVVRSGAQGHASVVGRHLRGLPVTTRRHMSSRQRGTNLLSRVQQHGFQQHSARRKRPAAAQIVRCVAVASPEAPVHEILPTVTYIHSLLISTDSYRYHTYIHTYK